MQKISAKYLGLIAGGLMVAVSLLMFYTLHLPEQGTVKYICYGIYTAAIILGLFKFKAGNAQEKTFKRIFFRRI
jgi:hypothetical protein